jgi:crossover junction endodeoxyribonuclease RuvC
MIIIGVDPGTLTTGYGVIESSKGRVTVLAYGAITNDAKRPMPDRLKLIYDGLLKVIAEYKPDEFAIETAFYGKNAQSALKLGQARGVSLLAAISNNLPIAEYSPREMKKALVGNGTASKQQVQFMVKSLLKMDRLPKQYDVTDALGVAVCHLHRAAKPGKTAFSSWKSYVAAHPEKLSRR